MLKAEVGARVGKEDDQSWCEQLGEVCEQVLVMRMQAVLRKIAGLRVVQDVVEWCDDGSTAKVLEQVSKGLGGCWSSVESRVSGYSHQCPECARQENRNKA